MVTSGSHIQKHLWDIDHTISFTNPVMDIVFPPPIPDFQDNILIRLCCTRNRLQSSPHADFFSVFISKKIIHIVHIVTECLFVIPCVFIPILINSCANCIRSKHRIITFQIFVKQCRHKNFCMNCILPRFRICTILINCQKLKIIWIMDIERNAFFYIPLRIKILCPVQIIFIYKSFYHFFLILVHILCVRCRVPRRIKLGNYTDPPGFRLILELLKFLFRVV